MHNETICALATPTGGALAIIRISGEKTLEILNNVLSKDLRKTPGNTTHYCRIGTDGETIDEAMVSLFRTPHSYTGEDCAEITFHGSPYIARRILNLLTDNGCRMARPGEYTQRAFLNGKMDLSQAEAVADLIASTNKATHQLAVSQLRGNISSRLALLRENLLHLTSMLELELDFSDHEELEFADRGELLTLAEEIGSHIQQLTRSFEQGKAMKEGIPVAIVGKTNVGKSTLLNALLKDDRAIVSNIHGTTRDTIEEAIDINGVSFRFIDTAGIRKTADTIEQIGIDRTYKAIGNARVVLWLIDAAPTAAEQAEMKERTRGKTLITVQNKIDQPAGETHHLEAADITISAKQGTHLKQLEELIFQAAHLPDLSEHETIISNARHYDILCQAGQHIRRVIEGMQDNLSGDLLSEDLRQTLSILAEITGGQITTDEVLANIFSHFCIGK